MYISQARVHILGLGLVLDLIALDCTSVVLPVEIVALFGESLERAHRVRPGAEDEHERRHVGHVGVQRRQVGARRLDERLTEILSNKLSHRKHHLRPVSE